MKKKIVKGCLVLGLICVFANIIVKNFAINNIKQVSGKNILNFNASEIIQIEDVSINQTIHQKSELVSVENLIGRYQFNYTGNGTAWTENQSSSTTLSCHVDICKPYEVDYKSYKGNSSGGYLDQTFNKNGTIFKAYLCVEINSLQNNIVDDIQAPITLLYGGKEGKKIESGLKSKISKMWYQIEDNTMGCSSGYIDVTEFVKSNGYGWYYICNIPYEHYKVGNDAYSGWKLIIIEENPNIPVRKLGLKLGYMQLGGTNTTQVIDGYGITTKKSGIVTGQLLYGTYNGDPGFASIQGIKYRDSSNSDILVTTTNGLRTTKTQFCLIMSRNGIPILNIGNHDKERWYDGTEFSDIQNNGSMKLSGADIELLDVDGKTDKHNVKFSNNSKEIVLKAWGGSCNLGLHILGANADIDVPTYSSVQTSIGHDTYYATINGTITNTSTSGDGMGMHDGKVIATVDKGLKILSTNAYFTTASGEKVNLTEDMYTINEEDNTITYIFGKDSNGKNLNGESLTYTIETQAIEADNIDGKKYTANNEVYASGKLINNNVETEHYMDKVVWDTSSVTIENPPYEYKTEDVNYIVEYYKNGEKVEEDTQTLTTTKLTVQSKFEIDKTQINTTDKYQGYKFEKIEIGDKILTELPNEIEEEKIIKVYYKTKELILSTKVNLQLANGKGGVELDWSDYDATDTYFVVYRKEENQTEWEKIVDLDDKLSSNSYIDILGNDKAKPSAPTVEVGTTQSDIQINLSSIDTGTTYSYYIEAYDVSTSTLMKSSNVKSVKI